MTILSQLDRVKRELKIRDYSPKTIKCYLYGLREYFSSTKGDFTTLNEEHIRNFLLASQERGVSPRSRNLFLNAIKFYYYQVVRVGQKIDVRSAKNPKSLPATFSRREVRKIVDAVTNNKHKLLLSLAYGSGLRVSEVVALKVGDLDFRSAPSASGNQRVGKTG